MRRYSDYLDGPADDPSDFFWHLTVEDETGPYADPEQLGSVFVWTEKDATHWTAWWVRGREHRRLDGTRAEVVAWARRQEAGRRWIHEPDGPWYVPLAPVDGEPNGQLYQVDPDDLGTVYVAQIDEDYWQGSWQRGDEHRDVDGTRAEVLAWARGQTASQYLISNEGEGYVPLPLQD